MIIGGDFNDSKPPKDLPGVKLIHMNGWTRLNILSRQNSKIDHWYTNDLRVNVGSLGIFKHHSPEFFKDKSIR